MNGGGIKVIASTPQFLNITVKNNIQYGQHYYNEYGGGGIYLENSNVTFKELFCTNNESRSKGGCIYSNNSSVDILNSLIENNSNNYYNDEAYTGGGAVAIWGSNADTLRIINTIIENNNSIVGGGIWVRGSFVFLENSTVSNNISSLNGGGLYGYYDNNTNINILNSTFENNFANYGGGIYINNYDIVINNESIFVNNSASNTGGGVFLYNSQVEIYNSSILNNQAPNGAGFFISSSYNPIIKSTLISGNSAMISGGGLYIDNSGTPILFNNTITDNNAAILGSGLFCSATNPVVQNSIFWGNLSADGAQVNLQDGSEIFVTFTDMAGGVSGIVGFDDIIYQDNINQNPQFTDSENQDYTLLVNSPCIDAGNPNAPQDPDGTIVDMGAFYFDQIESNPGCMDVTAQNYDADANYNIGCIYGPSFISLYDAPGDQGGFVYLNWERNSLDSLPNTEIEYYSVWRYLPDSESTSGLANENSRGWEHLTDVPASYEDTYGFMAPTIGIHAAEPENPTYTRYKIKAHTALQEVFYQSQIDSAYSVDNLSPNAPENFNVQTFDGYNLLTWSMPNLEDMSHFEVYNENGFISSTIDTFYYDDSYRSGDFSYTLLSYDINGNVSGMGSSNAQALTALGYGNNLIGFKGAPYTIVTQDLMDDLGDVKFILGQGVGLFNTSNGWSGNLNEIDPTKGYWVNIEANRDWALSYPEGFMDPCSQVHLTFGNNLLSYQGNTTPTIDALGGEELAQHFNFILGQGVGLFNTINGWSGNLNSLEPKNGYWLNVTSDYPWYQSGIGTPFRWNVNNDCEEPVIDLTKEIVDPFEAIPNEFRFTQSTEQAFYLISNIRVDNKYPKLEDILLAYHNNVLIGSANYSELTVLPIMGRDESDQTIGFIEVGQIPTLKLYKSSTGEMIELEANIEGFSNLLVSEVQTVTGSTIVIPNEYALHPAYPNPFNPVTNISYGIPLETHISLNIYNVEGKKIITLTEGIKSAGTHIVEWNAEGFPSGVYFVKLDADGFSETQKLMLVK